MTLLEFEGKDAEEAINKAAATLNVLPERLSFTLVSTGSKGIFGLGGRKAKILVDSGAAVEPDLEEPGLALDKARKPESSILDRKFALAVEKEPEESPGHEPTASGPSSSPLSESPSFEPSKPEGAVRHSLEQEGVQAPVFGTQALSNKGQYAQSQPKPKERPQPQAINSSCLLRKSPEPLSCRPKDGQSRQAEDGRAAADSLLSEKKGTVLAQREGIFEIQRPADGPGHSSQANPAKNVISEISKGKAEAASRESIFDIKPMGESAQAPVLPSRRKAALGAPEDGHLDNDASGEYPPLELDLSQLPLAPTQAGPGEEVYEGEPDKCMLMAAEILKNMVRFMGFGTEVKVNRIGERIILELLSEENALLIGRKGASLDALQLLVNKLCRKAYRKSAQKDEITDEAEEDSQRIIVDAENYRARRQQILLEKTLALANRVLRTRKPQTLPQLTAQERHLVHLALSQVEGLSTRSHGTGALRNLFIFPSNRQKG